MFESIDPATQSYAEKMTSPESDLLRKIERETHLNVDQPHMLSGHVQGVFLSMISRMIRPRNILEVGAFTGYSACCLATGLQPDGHIHTIDNNVEIEERVRDNFDKAGLSGCITLHIGEAATIIPSLQGPFDLVFIDADKISYPLYYDLVIDKVPSGGFLLADNVLFHGEVLKEEAQQSSNAKAITAFNNKVAADKRVEQVLLTLRDGLLLIRKK
jgi:predicted O-methyltransferase YrrM